MRKQSDVPEAETSPPLPSPGTPHDKSDGQEATPSTNSPGSTEHKLQADALEQLQLNGIADVFLLARRGNQAALWHLMQVLNQQPTRALSLPELVTALRLKDPSLDLRDVAADCRLLTLRGVLQEERRDGEIFYQIVPVASLVVEDELAEVSWMREAIRLLVADILHQIRVPGSGAFGGQFLHGVPRGMARPVLKKLRDALTTILTEAGDGPEQIQLFIAASIDTTDP